MISNHLDNDIFLDAGPKPQCRMKILRCRSSFCGSVIGFNFFAARDKRNLFAGKTANNKRPTPSSHSQGDFHQNRGSIFLRRFQHFAGIFFNGNFVKPLNSQNFHTTLLRGRSFHCLCTTDKIYPVMMFSIPNKDKQYTQY